MFIKNPETKIENIAAFQKAHPIDFSDKNLELLPEVYLDAPTPTAKDLVDNIERTLREFISSNDKREHY